MAISALLLGLVVGRVGKLPAYLTFKNALSNIVNVMDEASNIAELNGKPVTIVFNDGLFTPEDQRLKRSSDSLNYQVPSFVYVDFRNISPYNRKFVFFPDGSSSGPDIYFSYKGHTASLKLSKLTGTPILNIDG
jgi:hypothetical protein